jgi:hypothetical protein
MQSSYTDSSAVKAEDGARHWFGKQAPFWRITIAIAFTFLLAIFLHFKEVKVEVLEIGSTSKQYVIAQIDFDYPDEEATLVLKQMAMQDVGVIYQFDDKQLKKSLADFEDYLIQDPSWREKLSDVTYETLYEASDALEEFLTLVRLTDQRTLQKMKQLKISTEHYYPTAFIESRVSAIPEKFWADASEEALPAKSFDSKVVAFVIHFFESTTS